MQPLEITDVIVDFDPETLVRRPVRKIDALEQLRAAGASAFALAEVEKIPETAGALDPSAVDGIILSAHAEMQRLWETMAHGRRVEIVARALIAAARASGWKEKIRFVDVGCGCAYVIRWLAAHAGFGDDVQLIGVDYNSALIGRARRLAQIENLQCELLVANAFRLRQPATFYLSTGVLHHFRGSGLVELFRNQNTGLGFAHFDIRRNWTTPLGAWFFHKAKMRVRVGQYDGYMSAVRAHDTEDLLSAAKEGAPNFSIAELNRAVPYFPMLRAMHAIAGVAAELRDEFLRALGPEASAVGGFR